MSLIIFSCTSQSNLKKQHLTSGQCEKAFVEKDFGEGKELWSKVHEAGGTGVSYLLTGLGYSTDVIVMFTGGIAASVTICSPWILIESLGHAPLNISVKCVGEIGGKTAKALNPKLGPTLNKGTSQWRCPDLNPIYEGLLQVSSCYENAGEEKLAVEQLQNMMDSTVFQNCLSESNWKELKEKHRALSSHRIP